MKFMKTGGVLFLLAAACILGMPGAEAETAVGQADIERIYTEYSGMLEFEADMQEIQQEFQQAQEAGDQERLMELQQEFQARQDEFHRQFEAGLIEATEKVTEETGVQMVVAEVIYSAPDAEIIDVSDEVIEHMNEGAPGTGEGDAPVPLP